MSLPIQSGIGIGYMDTLSRHVGILCVSLGCFGSLFHTYIDCMQAFFLRVLLVGVALDGYALMFESCIAGKNISHPHVQPVGGF